MKLTKMQRVRRIVFGLVLCFLAALLAVEAKMAWAGCSGNSPSDLTAIKLCPSIEKWIATGSDAASLHRPAATASWTGAALPALNSNSLQYPPRPAARQRPRRAIAGFGDFSPALHLRPPPVC